MLLYLSIDLNGMYQNMQKLTHLTSSKDLTWQSSISTFFLW